MSSPLLSCSRLEVAYGRRHVLFGVDLDVHAGECVALLGTNGAGKSTLFRVISGLIEPTAGSVHLDGQAITSAGDAVRRGVVHVPGGRGVFPTLTVAEHFTTSSYLGEGIDAAVELFPILRERWQRAAGELSGGEQHQLAVATALVTEPRLLLLDELSLGLAPAVVEALIGVVSAINARGCAVVLVDQSLDLAERLAPRACFMERGQVRFDGPIEELADRRDLVRPVFLTRGRGGATTTPLPRHESALSVRSLRKTYGGVLAVDNVSFDVAAGSIVGLVGPNGAGKTTVIDLVSGSVRADGGRVFIGPKDVTRLRPHQRARLGLGRSFQDARLFPSLTVSEALAVAFESHLEVRDHLAATLSLPAARAMERKLAEEVSGLLEDFGLDAYRDSPVSELSTGTRRVLELAMTVAHRPRVLLLDEPSAGLAHAETGELAAHLLRVRADTGCAMVIVEHDIPLVESIADRVITMERGNLGRSVAAR